LDGCVPVHFRSGIAGAAGQSLTELCRIDISVHGIPKPAKQVVRRNQRMPAGAFFGVYDLEVNVHPACHRGKMAISLHLFFGVGQPDAAVAVVIVDRIIRIIRQLFVQADRMRFQADHRLVHPEIRYLRRRVPRRAAGQLVALDEYDVAPAFAGEVVKSGATGDAPADNDDFGARFHGYPRSGFLDIVAGSRPLRSTEGQ
jgi:hypothetical protein